MAGKRRRVAAGPSQGSAAVLVDSDISQSSAADEWAPDNVELGHTLSQVLRRPTRKTQAVRSTRSKQQAKAPVGSKNPKRPPVPPQTRARGKASKVSVKETKERHMVDEAVGGDESVGDVAPSKAEGKGIDTQLPSADEPAPKANAQDEIAAMFDDDNDAGVVAEAAKDGNAYCPARKPGMADGCDLPTSPQNMEFMDKESAMNHRNLLVVEIRNGKQKAAKNTSVGQQPRTSRHSSSMQAIDKQASAAATPPSLDDLPNDPLSAAPRPTTHAAAALERRRVHQISDSEGAEDTDALDSSAVLDRRLRPKASPSKVRSRLEQARLNMRSVSYDTETESEADDIDQFASQADSRDQVDLLESDSETVRRGGSTLVIRDSSEEDDDYISEPEGRPGCRGAAQKQPSQQQHSSNSMGKFLALFEERYRRQMQKRASGIDVGRGRGKIRISSGHTALPKRAKGYDEDLDDDISDFIVDDEDEVDDIVDDGAAGHTGGGPDSSFSDSRAAALSLPEEFSQFDLPSSFKAYTQYLVYWIANRHQAPAFSADTERYFFLAYMTVSRVVDSVEQSLVSSSAWVDDFRHDLHSYPEFAASHISGVPGCDACHFHKNRTATFCVALSGVPYDRAMLIPPGGGVHKGAPVSRTGAASIDDSDDSDDSDNDDSSCRMEEESASKKPRSVSYNVGRVCKSRSEVCHELHHFFYHLASSVEVALATLPTDRDGHAGRPPQDVDPGDLVNMLDDQGTIDTYFEDFKALISRAKSGYAS